MSFQTSVGVQPAPAVAGDFASSNPRWTALAGPGGLLAGTAGVTIGRFAWLSQQVIDVDNAAAIVNSFGTGPVGGFVHREQQALITAFLADSGMTIPSGFPVSLFTGGDFWVKNEGATAAQAGQYAYAAFGNGAASFAAANSAA